MPDRYCPVCGEEQTESVRYCPNCGKEVINDNTETAESETDETSWDWTDPDGPFQSPRNVLDTLNVIGLGIIGVGLVLTLAGFDSPYAILPSPVDTALLVYVLAVVFVGLPIWFILALTDNVLGFLKHG